MYARVTYVIGGDGKIAKVFPKVNPSGHADEVLAVLRSMPQ
jgi:peroxiredoxin